MLAALAGVTTNIGAIFDTQTESVVMYDLVTTDAMKSMINHPFKYSSFHHNKNYMGHNKKYGCMDPWIHGPIFFVMSNIFKLAAKSTVESAVEFKML